MDWQCWGVGFYIYIYFGMLSMDLLKRGTGSSILEESLLFCFLEYSYVGVMKILFCVIGFFAIVKNFYDLKILTYLKIDAGGDQGYCLDFGSRYH